MKPHDDRNAPTIVFRAHRPERLVRSLARGHIAGVCCCCCCCLHSVGSLAGAVLGSFFPSEGPSAGAMQASAKLRDDELDGPVRTVPAAPAGTSIYWLSTLAVTVYASVISLLIYGAGAFPGVLGGLMILFPLVQLGGSLLCAFVIAVHPRLHQRAAAWKRLGWITLGSVVGCAIGIVAMIGVFRR